MTWNVLILLHHAKSKIKCRTTYFPILMIWWFFPFFSFLTRLGWIVSPQKASAVPVISPRSDRYVPCGH